MFTTATRNIVCTTQYSLCEHKEKRAYYICSKKGFAKYMYAVLLFPNAKYTSYYFDIQYSMFLSKYVIKSYSILKSF